MKAAVFLGNSRLVISEFPYSASREAGFQIDKVQRGLDPDDWKPMSGIGRGVREIPVRDETGAYRIIYIATFPTAVYILHAFQKKTQATSKYDLDLAAMRLKELIRRSPS